jgi:hypothetical protein
VAVMVALAVFVSYPNHLSDAAVMVMLAVFASSPIRLTTVDFGYHGFC